MRPSVRVCVVGAPVGSRVGTWVSIGTKVEYWQILDFRHRNCLRIFLHRDECRRGSQVLFLVLRMSCACS